MRFSIDERCHLRERMFLRLAMRFEIGEIADGPQQMLIDRIVVIHVELHQGDDAAEFRNEAAEHAGLVHQPQHDFRRITRGENIEKQPHWPRDRRAT